MKIKFSQRNRNIVRAKQFVHKILNWQMDLH